jgi:hypothetical protein
MSVKRPSLRNSLAGMAILAVAPLAILASTAGTSTAHPAGSGHARLLAAAASGASGNMIHCGPYNIVNGQGKVIGHISWWQAYPPPCP